MRVAVWSVGSGRVSVTRIVGGGSDEELALKAREVAATEGHREEDVQALVVDEASIPADRISRAALRIVSGRVAASRQALVDLVVEKAGRMARARRSPEEWAEIRDGAAEDDLEGLRETLREISEEG